jgi:hypothetical protein
MKLPKQSPSVSEEFGEIRYRVMASSIEERGVRLSFGGGGSQPPPQPAPPLPQPAPPSNWTGRCASSGTGCFPDDWTFSQYCQLLYGSAFPIACIRSR